MLARSLITALAVLMLSSTALARSSPSSASQAQSFPVPPVRAWAASVMDANTGKILVSVNAHRHLAIASTTKVMTAVLALEMGKLTDRIRVPKGAFNYEWDATVMGLKPGQVVTLRDLLYGLMLPSGADAANTIAIHYGGSEAHWVELMNRRAAQLGMRDTHYGSAHGLDVKGQYSSAFDLTLLGLYASTIPALMTITSTPSYTWNGQTLPNLNHVINWYPGADGIKPGFTNAAGSCQLLDARRHGQHVIAAILHTPDLVIDARNLLNYGLSDFSWAQTVLPGDSPALVQTGTYAGVQYGYFLSTGHYVRGKFWQAYLADGRSAVLGFPRTEPIREGGRLVQYFQNAALAQDSAGRITRLVLGASPLPSSTPTPVPTGREGAVTIGATSTPPRPRVTPTPVAVPTVTPPLSVDRVFAAYQKAHARDLGGPAGPAWRWGEYTVQVFRYGALTYSSRAKRTWSLPVGDRFLAARHYLPKYPGNTYPSNFAPRSVLTYLRWL